MVDVRIFSKTVRHKFLVMNNLNGHVLVGDELLKKLDIRLRDPQGHEVGGSIEKMVEYSTENIYDLTNTVDVMSKPSDSDKGFTITKKDVKPIEECGAISEETIECPWIKEAMIKVESDPAKCPNYANQNENFDVLVGQFRTRKTINRICGKYYWPVLYRDVKKFIGTCQSCSQYKIPQIKPARNRHIIPTTDPWQVITVSSIGILPRSRQRHKQLLLMQDKFTKWIENIDLGKITSSALKRILKERIICRHGWPELITGELQQQCKIAQDFLQQNKTLAKEGTIFKSYSL